MIELLLNDIRIEYQCITQTLENYYIVEYNK